VDEGLDLLLFVHVLLLLGDLLVDCVGQTGAGVWIVCWGGIRKAVRYNARIVAVIIFDVTGIMKIE
jgi:hypothetical protein